MTNCGICESKVQAISQHPLQSSTLLEAQLNVIFFLKHIYELRSDQLEPYLQKWGNPGDWLKLCGSCEDDVSSTRRIFEKLHQISREFEGKKRALKEKIENVERERVVDKTRPRRTAGVQEALNECRRTICRSRRTVTPLILHNPFKVGDLKASELALKQELQINVKEEIGDEASGPNKLDLDDAYANYHELTFHDENSCPPTPASDSEVKGNSDEYNHFNFELLENKPNLLPVWKRLRSRKKIKYTEECSGSGDEEELLHSKARSKPERKKTIVMEKMPAKQTSACRRIKCPVCMILFEVKVGSSLLTFSKHFQACISSLAESSNLELKCSLCRKWSCGKANVREFMEHVALCRYGDQSSRIPWRDAILKCNLCEGQHSLYLPFPDYIQHVFQYHQHRYRCSQCPYRAKLSQDLVGKHWQRHHKNHLDVPNSERFTTEENKKMVPLPYIPWWCPGSDCLQEFGDEASRDGHLRTCVKEVPERSHMCSFCEREYFSEEELLMHRVTSHGYRTLSNAHKCNACGIILKNSRQLLSHRRRKHGLDLLACDKCNEKFADSTIMLSHIRLKHGHKDDEELKQCTCEHCGKVFGLKSTLRKHIIRVHENPKVPRPRPKRNRRFRKKYVLKRSSFLCSFCGKQFSYARWLSLHTKLCRLPHKCGKCKLRFATREMLKQHKVEVHVTKLKSATTTATSSGKKERKLIPDGLQAPSTSFTYFCDWESCGKMFRSRPGLYKHRKSCHSHESEGGKATVEVPPPPKPKSKSNDKVICDICGAELSRDNLRKHILSLHEKKLPVSCDICGKGFPFKSTMLIHKSIAHKIGDFKCDVKGCSRVFYSAQVLEQHKKFKHEGVSRPKNYFCQFCGKAFSHKSHLKHHEQAMYTNKDCKPFKCDLCEKTFATRNYRNYHLKHTHKLSQGNIQGSATDESTQ